MATAVATVTSRTSRRARPLRVSPCRGATRCRRKFLRYFRDGFADQTYFDWERGYKERAHERWNETLSVREFRALLRANEYGEIARRAVAIEARTNLLFSFEKIALRDAVRTPAFAQRFAEGLFLLLHGRGSPRERFEGWTKAVASLPRAQTRVLSWPTATVFGFLGRPDEQFFVKPTVTRRAAEAYGFELAYASRPAWDTYASVLAFAAQVRRDLDDLKPRDMIDLQSFVWILGSDEYPW